MLNFSTNNKVLKTSVALIYAQKLLIGSDPNLICKPSNFNLSKDEEKFNTAVSTFVGHQQPEFLKLIGQRILRYEVPN